MVVAPDLSGALFMALLYATVMLALTWIAYWVATWP